jgi:hypothetical protein
MVKEMTLRADGLSSIFESYNLVKLRHGQGLRKVTVEDMPDELAKKSMEVREYKLSWSK